MRSGFISIIGRPSSGKSTLLNALTGQKVSIVSPVPQTTRNTIRGIINIKDSGLESQMVFLDTPGYHLSEKKMNQYLKDIAITSLEGTDLLLYILDGTRIPGSEEESLGSIVSSWKGTMVIGVNKSDVALKPEVNSYLDENFPDEPRVFFSAKTGKGLSELKKVLYEKIPEGPPMYPEDFYTDQDPEFRISEIIREKAMAQGKEELPHAIYVEIADMEQKKNGLWVRAFITVEKESQKGIMVGKGGATIKKIRTESKKDLKEIFPYPIHLDLKIKVNPKWRRKDYLLKGMLH
jgi:GTP-binding protein Era